MSQIELTSEETPSQDLIIKKKKSVAQLQEKARLETPSPQRTMKHENFEAKDQLNTIEVTPD